MQLGEEVAQRSIDEGLLKDQMTQRQQRDQGTPKRGGQLTKLGAWSTLHSLQELCRLDSVLPKLLQSRSFPGRWSSPRVWESYLQLGLSESNVRLSLLS